MAGQARPPSIMKRGRLTSWREREKVGTAVGNESICVLARKQFLPMMNQTWRKVSNPELSASSKSNLNK